MKVPKKKLFFILEMYFQAVDLEDADIPDLPDLTRVKQFHLACALVEVVAQGDAVVPALDLPALGPKLDINRVSSLEHPAKGADVDTLCHNVFVLSFGPSWSLISNHSSLLHGDSRIIGMRGQTLR